VGDEFTDDTGVPCRMRKRCEVYTEFQTDNLKGNLQVHERMV